MIFLLSASLFVLHAVYQNIHIYFGVLNFYITFPLSYFRFIFCILCDHFYHFVIISTIFWSFTPFSDHFHHFVIIPTIL